MLGYSTIPQYSKLLIPRLLLYLTSLHLVPQCIVNYSVFQKCGFLVSRSSSSSKSSFLFHHKDRILYSYSKLIRNKIFVSRVWTAVSRPFIQVLENERSWQLFLKLSSDVFKFLSPTLSSCLLLRDKVRDKYKTYVWVSVWLGSELLPKRSWDLGDEEVQHQRHRTRLIHEVFSQLDVPTLLNPASRHLFFFTLCVVWKRSTIWSTTHRRESSWYPSVWYKCRGTF